MIKTLTQFDNGVREWILIGAVALAAVAAALALAYDTPGHPGEAIFIGVLAFLGWVVGSLDDDGISLVRLGIFAVLAVVLLLMAGIAGLGVLMILSFIWAMARTLTGGEDGGAFVVFIVLLLALAAYQ